MKQTPQGCFRTSEGKPAELKAGGWQMCIVFSLHTNTGNLIRQFVSSFSGPSSPSPFPSLPFPVQIQRPAPGQIWRTSPCNINMQCCSVFRMECEIHDPALWLFISSFLERMLIEVFKSILGWRAFNFSAQVAIIWRKVVDCLNIRLSSGFAKAFLLKMN